MHKPLDNLHVVVTRPAHQAQPICDIIEQEGGQVIRWPLLAITPITISTETRAALKSINRYDKLIFISVNAVEFALKTLEELTLNKNEIQGQLFAVGQATANALYKAGFAQVLTPEHASTEGLLTMPDFAEHAIRQQRCLIIRGQGGRECMADGIRQRGATTVDYAEVYKRVPSPSDPAILTERWQAKKLDIIIVSSGAGLESLMKQFTGSCTAQLLQTPLAVISQRVADRAMDLGFKSILITKSANDNDVIAALRQWHLKRNLS